MHISRKGYSKSVVVESARPGTVAWYALKRNSDYQKMIMDAIAASIPYSHYHPCWWKKVWSEEERMISEAHRRCGSATVQDRLSNFYRMTATYSKFNTIR